VLITTVVLFASLGLDTLALALIINEATGTALL